MVQPPVPSDNHAKRLTGDAEPSARGMIHRVAAAIEAADAHPDTGKRSWDWYYAVAAIGAMLEPTEEMLSAARDAVWGFSPDYATTKKDPAGTNEDSAEFVGRNVWRAMLSAALGNAPPSDGGMGPATHEGPSGNGLNQNPPTGDQP